GTRLARGRIRSRGRGRRGLRRRELHGQLQRLEAKELAPHIRRAVRDAAAAGNAGGQGRQSRWLLRGDRSADFGRRRRGQLRRARRGLSRRTFRLWARTAALTLAEKLRWSGGGRKGGEQQG